MGSNLPASVLQDLKEAFNKILSLENFGAPVNELAGLIAEGEFSIDNISDVMKRYGIRDIAQLKPQTLDMILAYVRAVVSDNVITAREAENVKFLKRFFKIQEGDFYSLRRIDVEQVLDKQLQLMFQNRVVDNEEALQKVDLQAMFDLSYDQFLKLSENAVKVAIDSGADPMNLDTFIKSA
ncbi:MAG: hypothetical protein EOP48_30630 [Sphingobacteriales bacterium]|nr:MAG: hypothetical protein EOP48_30630 [Sphingobacteriales bacterium]